ncbi:hypothetical protein AB0K48_56365 [Nonomuraea sp. NPDC055795]
MAPGACNIAQAANDWLAYGLSGLDRSTVATSTILVNTHIIPALGKRKLRDLSAQNVDKWLAGKAKTHSTSTPGAASLLSEPDHQACHGARQGPSERG